MNPKEKEDKSIHIPDGPLNKYGARLFIPKYIKIKADTSTSKEVEWREDKKLERIKPEKEDINIIYKSSKCTDGENKGNKLDLHMNIMYHPNSKNPSNIILVIPGGGFLFCDIHSSLIELRQNLHKNNFAVAAIEYHVVGNGFYYDVLEDIKDAIEYLKNNEKKYNINVNNLVILGNSAGGYFTALYTIKNPKGIKCAIDLYGLSDLSKVGIDFDDECHNNHLTQYSTESMYIFGCESGKGINYDLNEVQKSNPVNFVNGNEPPFLFMHGDNDNLVSNSQTLFVHNKILEKKGKSVRYVLKGDGHGEGGFDTESCFKIILDFINENVK